MSYDIALNKAWEDLAKLNPVRNTALSNMANKISNGVNPQSSLSVKFLNDDYSIDLHNKQVLSWACNIPAKDFITILILHYLVQKLKGLPSFRLCHN